MRCKRCGEELPARARYCFVCGEPVEDVPAPHRLEEPLDPMAAGAVPMVPVAPPPRAVRIEPRRTHAATHAAHPGAAPGAAEFRRRVPEQVEHRADEAPAGGEGDASPSVEAQPSRGASPAEGAERPTKGTPSARDRLTGVRERLAASRVPWAVPVVGAVVVVAVLAVVVGVSTSWIGPFARPSEEAPQVQPPSDGSLEPLAADDEATPAEEEPAAEGEPAVRDSVEDYSWDELTQISALIAAADTDDEGTQIAARYNLCAADGSLDGTQTKDLELSDGTTVTCAVAGFRHDERSDGEGVAGITFVSLEPLGVCSYGSEGPVSWEDSPLRSWLNQSLMGKLPEGLADAIVPVDKETNDLADSGGDTLVTSDRLWAPSFTELCGGALSQEMGPEGSQYQLFADEGVDGSATSDLALADDYWWMRSPSSDARWQGVVTPDGDPHYARNPLYEFDVIAGFCL